MTLVLASALPVWSGDDDDEGKKEKRGKPKLVLKVDPAVGFTPVIAFLTGDLTGVDPHDQNFCHASVTWLRIDPGRGEDEALRMRQDPVCLHAEEDSRVAMSHTKIFTLYRPGSYLFRLMIEGKDGKRVDSGYTQVRVLSVR